MDKKREKKNRTISFFLPLRLSLRIKKTICENLMYDEKNKFPSNFVSSQFVPYLEKSEIKSLVETLGHTLSQRYKGQELVIIGVLKGSMVFIADLVREIKGVKVYIDFVKLSSQGRSKESHGTVTLAKDISTNIQDRNVLIVEEIIDTGRALHFLKHRLHLSEPRSLEILTLFDKPYKRAVKLVPDYIGKKIDDQFIVGYGLDLEEYGRNFEEIYYLKYPN